MGFLDRLFGRRPEAVPTVTMRTAPAQALEANDRYDLWVEPSLTLPNEEWARRLTSYGRRCARELAEKGLPLWRSRYPREGSGTFRDAFWVVSVDVDAAERFYVQHLLHNPSGTPQSSKKNDFGGMIRGNALLLSKTGGVFSSRIEMWFPSSGNHEEGDLDSIFHPPSLEHLRSSPWAGLNTGRWKAQRDAIVYGVPVHTNRSEFRSAYRPGAWSGTKPGKGSSIALNKFVATGKTQWPRWFDEYYGR